MVNQDALSQLKDIHWPESPSWWPPAVGYYGVLFVLLLLTIGLWLLIRRLMRRWRLKHAILSELRTIETRFIADDNVAALQASIDALLRRMALALYGQQISRAADLVHMAPYIKSMMKNPHKTEELIELLTKNRFRKDPDVDGLLLVTLTREQIKRCRI